MPKIDCHSACGEVGFTHPSQLAMVYSPPQSWQMLYTPEVGFKKGTIFEELDKPLVEVCQK